MSATALMVAATLAAAGPVAAAPLAAGPVTAAPLAAAPVLGISPAVAATGVADVAVTDAGDALLVLARITLASSDDPPTLWVRQRRGPRGAFTAPVAVARSASYDVASALSRIGDAYVVYPGPGGLVVRVRRGWTGRWRTLSPPTTPGAEVSAPRIAIPPTGGRHLDVLWREDRDPRLGTGGRAVRVARLAGSSWLTEPGLALTPDYTRLATAIAAGGAALVVAATADGRILSWSKPSQGRDYPWEGAVELATVVAPTGSTGTSVSAEAGTSALYAGWTGIPTGGTGMHAFFARRLGGAPAWEPPVDLGAGVGEPTFPVTGSGWGAAWPLREGDSDKGAGPLLLRVWSPPGVLEPPVTLPATGSTELHVNYDGSWVAGVFAGLNTASSTSAIVYRDGPSAPVRRTRVLVGSSRDFAAGARSALLAVSAPENLGVPAYVGVDRLGPLGLTAPRRATAGRSLTVRLRLWRRTRVTLQVLGGPARAAVTRTLPAGGSVVRLMLPARARAYLLRATGREIGGRAGLRQQVVVRTG